MRNQILFVDDEPKFLDGVRRMLHSQEDIWDMRFARSVDEALEELRENNFDMVISDVNMPDKDGFQFLEILAESESTKDIPVVILTGTGEHDLKRKALARGATDLLNKPVVPEDLLARIRSVLQLKSYQDQLKDQNRILEEKVQERTAELEESRLDVILRLGKAAEYRDEETGNHILRVGSYCRVLAEELGMECASVELIFLASPLHDIGKIGVPDSILLKKGRLKPSERKVMQQHCHIGADILLQQPSGMKNFLIWRTKYSDTRSARSENPLLQMATTIALSHHEKWDGSGYPQALQGEQIPLPGRIVALADVYDALRSTRPYKEAFSEDETLAIMRDEAVSHFDPMVFAAFEDAIGVFGSIHKMFGDDESQKEAIYSAAEREFFSELAGK